MDEVFKALGSSSNSEQSSDSHGNSLPPLLMSELSPGPTPEDNEAHNVRNEIKEMAFKFSSSKDNSKKKQAMVCIFFMFVIEYRFLKDISIIT